MESRAKSMRPPSEEESSVLRPCSMGAGPRVKVVVWLLACIRLYNSYLSIFSYYMCLGMFNKLLSHERLRTKGYAPEMSLRCSDGNTR